MTDVPVFHQLGKEAIADQNPNQPRKEGERKRLHFQQWRNGRKRNNERNHHDQRGDRRKRCTGPTLDERNFSGSNHVYNQCLRNETFYKPTRLKQGLMIRRVGFENKEQYSKSNVVKN